MIELPKDFSACKWEEGTTPTPLHFVCIYMAFFERAYFVRAKTIPFDFMGLFDRGIVSTSFINMFNNILEEFLPSLSRYCMPYKDEAFGKTMVEEPSFLNYQMLKNQLFYRNYGGNAPKKEIMKWLISLKEFICKFTFYRYLWGSRNVRKENMYDGFNYPEEYNIKGKYYLETFGNAHYPANHDEQYLSTSEIINKSSDEDVTFTEYSDSFSISLEMSQFGYRDESHYEKKLVEVTSFLDFKPNNVCYVGNRCSFNFKLAYWLDDSTKEETEKPSHPPPGEFEDGNIWSDIQKIYVEPYNFGIKNMEFNKINVLDEIIPAYSLTKINFIKDEDIQQLVPEKFMNLECFELSLYLRPKVFWQDFNVEGGFDFR